MFSNRVVNTWNSLSEEVVDAPSLDSFKNRFDKYWETQNIVYSYKEMLDFHAPDPEGTVTVYTE